jgi:uncharacterized small protein (DUF1192 family)
MCPLRSGYRARLTRAYKNAAADHRRAAELLSLVSVFQEHEYRKAFIRAELARMAAEDARKALDLDIAQCADGSGTSANRGHRRGGSTAGD